jgi:hypothetical protein
MGTMTKAPASTGEIIRALGRMADSSRDNLDASWMRAAIDRLGELHDAARIAYGGLGAIPRTAAWNEANAALSDVLQVKP